MSSCEWCDELGMSINPGPVIKTDILQPPKKIVIVLILTFVLYLLKWKKRSKKQAEISMILINMRIS